MQTALRTNVAWPAAEFGEVRRTSPDPEGAASRFVARFQIERDGPGFLEPDRQRRQRLADGERMMPITNCGYAAVSRPFNFYEMSNATPMRRRACYQVLSASTRPLFVVSPMPAVGLNPHGRTRQRILSPQRLPRSVALVCCCCGVQVIVLNASYLDDSRRIDCGRLGLARLVVLQVR